MAPPQNEDLWFHLVAPARGPVNGAREGVGHSNRGEGLAVSYGTEKTFVLPACNHGVY